MSNELLCPAGNLGNNPHLHNHMVIMYLLIAVASFFLDVFKLHTVMLTWPYQVLVSLQVNLIHMSDPIKSISTAYLSQLCYIFQLFRCTTSVISIIYQLVGLGYSKTDIFFIYLIT